MTELFENGFINNRGYQDNYYNIVVGLAPGGAVSVWLFSAERVTEVGHYQADKTEVEMKDFRPDGLQNRDLYIKNREESFTEETKKSNRRTRNTNREVDSIYRALFKETSFKT